MSKHVVIDLEVSAESRFGRFCDGLDSTNKITSIGVYLSSTRKVYTKYDAEAIPRNIPMKFLKDFKVLVGHNIKFDLLYFYNQNDDFMSWLKAGGRVWDTMLVEYLLECQQPESLKLDALSAKYNGTSKDSDIGELYKAGIKSNQIPKEKLLEYNIQDVLNTNLIFGRQLIEVRRRNILPLVLTYNEHLLATVEMEANGLYVNKEIAVEEQLLLEAKLKETSNLVDEAIQKLATTPVSVDSPKDLSLLFFGGDYTVIEDQKLGVVYKTGARKGEEKTKKVSVVKQAPRLFFPRPEWLGKNGYYSVGDDVLEVLKRDNKELGIFKLIQSYRALKKLLSTYYYQEILGSDGEVKRTTGILTKVFPSTGTIHSSFNSTVTATGRLSSSNPNGQNLPADIMNMFTSRYEDGYIIEFDMSQLEIVVQAFLTQSENMINSIKLGRDFHRLRLSYALDTTYEDVIKVKDYDKKRKEIAKPISFQKAYGAHPKTVHERTGIPLSTVEKVFQKEDEDHPEIASFYEDVVAEVKSTAEHVDELADIRDKAANTTYTLTTERQKQGYYTSITGKRYRFTEKVMNTKRGLFRYYHMPDIQNYPVQGTAADIVSLIVGTVFRFLLHHTDKCVMIQEIHDSLILDCRAEHLDFILKEVGTIMNDGQNLLEKRFGFKFNVPLKSDVKYGRSWKQCKES